MSLVANQARAHPNFRSMKQLGAFLLPHGWDLAYHRVTHSSKSAGTRLYTWVARGTMRVKCLAQEHNAVPWPGLKLTPLHPELRALTIRPPRLPHFIIMHNKKYSKHPHIRTHNFRGQTDCVLIYRMLSEKSASGCS